MTKDIEIQKSLKLINNELFSEAEKSLLQLRKKENTAYINYLLGYIHYESINPGYFRKDKDSFRGSKTEAKRYLREAIATEDSIEDAYWRLADIEDNKKQSDRIIKKGLEIFPNSKTIYSYLIRKSEYTDNLKYFNDIEIKKIVSNSLYFQFYECFWNAKDYNKALICTNKIKLKISDEKLVLSLIEAFCWYELSETEKAKVIFQKLIDDDVKQVLNYGQYIGLSLCLFKLDEIEEVVNLVDEFPIRFYEPFVDFYPSIRFQFNKYQENLFKKLLNLLKTKKSYKSAYAKIRGVIALIECGFEHINKKVISDLVFAKNNLQDSQEIETELVQAYTYTGKIYEAFKQDMKNINIYSEYETRLSTILYKISKEELKIITDKFANELESANSWDRKKFADSMSHLIEVLYKNQDYKSIIKISNYFLLKDLEKKSVLFEVAFAYKENNDEESAKFYYEKIWNKEQNSSAVANNLAIIYEKEDDYYKAEELLIKAIELDPDDKIANDNIRRVRKRIADEEKEIEEYQKDQEQVFENIKVENIYIIQKLLSLLENQNKNGFIIASYLKLNSIFRTQSEKTQELIKSFQKKMYIFKVEDHGINTRSNVYRVSFIVRKYVLEQKERIKKNMPLLNIGGKINLDSFEKLGFDKSLLLTIESKIRNIDLIEILKRDLKENVFALLTGCYKTSLVMSGSIIEALILNKILNSNISKHLPSLNSKKNKSVLKMNLSELLFVANQNNIIEIQLYHFSQALREYRNFIHPAVEIRKGKSEKTLKEDSELAWRITKKIINEI